MEIGEITGSNVLVHWKIIKGSLLEIPDDIKAAKEAQENGVSQIAAVGPDCKIAKVGHWAILNAGGRVISYNGNTYGVIKEHQIDVVLKERPELNSNVIGDKENFSNVKLDKTIGKLSSIKRKHNI